MINVYLIWIRPMPNRRNRVPRWPIAIAAVVIAFAAGAGWLIRNVRSGVQEAYAKWGLAEIIIAYADEHDGEPPENSRQLSPSVVRSRHLPQSWKVEDIRKCLEVDFAALRDLADNPSPAGAALPSLVQSRSGRGDHVEGDEPNALLWDYYLNGDVLRGRRSRGTCSLKMRGH